VTTNPQPAPEAKPALLIVDDDPLITDTLAFALGGHFSVHACESRAQAVDLVRKGMGSDRRIGFPFLFPGIGYGGSCFPKDVKALAHMASMAGAHPQLLRAVMEINRDMRRLVLQKVRGTLGSVEDRTIGVLGPAICTESDCTAAGSVEFNGMS